MPKCGASKNSKNKEPADCGKNDCRVETRRAASNL